MFVACGIWCLADVSSVSPSSEQTALSHELMFPYRAFATLSCPSGLSFHSCQLPSIAWWYDDNGDNTLFSTPMTLGRTTRILLSKKIENRLTKSVDKNPFDSSSPSKTTFSRDATD